MQRKILILCTGNSCRSQMAQAIINSERGEAWEAVSAGTKPADQVNPKALQVLDEIGIHTQGSQPRHLSEFLGQKFDLVVTVCDDAAENCPVWPGQGKRVHLSFPDPADATGTVDEVLGVFREVRDDIHDKMLALVDSA